MMSIGFFASLGECAMTMTIDCLVKEARADFSRLAIQHAMDFQHEEVLAASQRLDILIIESQKRKIGSVKPMSPHPWQQHS
jgi:hypothetical protein